MMLRGMDDSFVDICGMSGQAPGVGSNVFTIACAAR
jgi:hypothetical protein